MEGQKVITAEEMARVEKASIQAGADAAEYMEEAGKAIAQFTHEFISHHHLEPLVTLLVGKGNNGGDAFVAGRYLLERGYQVVAWPAFKRDEVSALSAKHWETFERLGGKCVQEIAADGVILDGLLGTGFKGAVQEPMAGIIEIANASTLPILAIDIPSGLNGNDGSMKGPAICATFTLYLGMPKIGFFLRQAIDQIGALIGCDFGLEPFYYEQAQAIAYLLDEESTVELLPPVKPSRHKYETGYILACAGSPGMMGAAHMACMAAYRTGAGIVRLFQEESKGPEEIVHSAWDPDLFLTEQKRAKAHLIGPGMGRDEVSEQRFAFILKHLEKPCVIDADGLFCLAKQKAFVFQTPAVLTPHRKEMLRLLDLDIGEGLAFLDACQRYAEEKNATLVLKGAPTFIFSPDEPILIVQRGGPGLAKAGTGDVLTGIIAAYLVQGLQPREAAALGVWLHGLVGERVTLDKTEYGLIATDLIEAIPEVLAELI